MVACAVSVLMSKCPNGDAVPIPTLSELSIVIAASLSTLLNCNKSVALSKIIPPRILSAESPRYRAAVPLVPDIIFITDSVLTVETFFTTSSLDGDVSPIPTLPFESTLNLSVPAVVIVNVSSAGNLIDVLFPLSPACSIWSLIYKPPPISNAPVNLPAPLTSNSTVGVAPAPRLIPTLSTDESTNNVWPSII